MGIAEDLARRLGISVEQAFKNGSATMGPEAYKTYMRTRVTPPWFDNYALDTLGKPPRKATNLLRGGTDGSFGGPMPIMGLGQGDLDPAA